MKNRISVLGIFLITIFLLAEDTEAWVCKLGGKEVSCDNTPFVFWGVVLVTLSVLLASFIVIISLFKEKTLSFGEFNKQVAELSNELNLRRDEHHFDHLKLDFLRSISYSFSPAVGMYKGRTLEIAPSSYPYFISDTGLSGNIDDILLRQLNPSVKIQSKVNRAAYDYMVIRMEMKTDIGMPSVLICPNTVSNRVVGLYTMLRGSTKTSYTDFDKKYLTSLGNQDWFLNCLSKEIMDSMISLELPKYRGAIFQFSKNHCTFSIVPRAIGKDKLMRIIDILERIAKNIEGTNLRQSE